MDERLKVCVESVFELLGVAFQEVAYIKNLRDGIQNLSDKILINKLNRLFNNLDIDFNERMKICTGFNEDNKNYEKNVKTLIYTINVLVEEDLIDVYANLLKSFSYGKIDNDILFKLSKILLVSTKTELDLLKENSQSNELPENPLSRSLMQNGLFYDPAGNRLGLIDRTDDMFECKITQLGRLMIEHGLSYYNGQTTFIEIRNANEYAPIIHIPISSKSLDNQGILAIYDPP